MDAQETLDKFGEFLMKKYRDKGIFKADGLLSNYWKAPALKEMQDALAELSESQKQLVRKVVEEVLDSAMHDFLFAVTENEDIQIRVDGENVAELSDGLHGESYGENGWIAKYSKYKEVD
jgi:hypothetical protein